MVCEKGKIESKKRRTCFSGNMYVFYKKHVRLLGTSPSVADNLLPQLKVPSLLMLYESWNFGRDIAVSTVMLLDTLIDTLPDWVDFVVI